MHWAFLNIWLIVSEQLRNASRHALHLWKGRDAAHVAFGSRRSRDGSEESSYAQTLIGNGPRHRSNLSDHNLLCSGCSRVVLSPLQPSIWLTKLQLISGVRYQCGRCPSRPAAYNLVHSIRLIKLWCSSSCSARLANHDLI